MFRDRFAAATLLMSVTTWLLVSLASMNADYKAEVGLAPTGSGRITSYSEFLLEQGFRLLQYFVPYGSSPILWFVGLAGFVALFTPFLAALLATHKPIRVLCTLVAVFSTYAAAEVLLALPSANRNGCEDCDNVRVFQALSGAVLLVVAAVSRAINQAKLGKPDKKARENHPEVTPRNDV